MNGINQKIYPEFINRLGSVAEGLTSKREVSEGTHDTQTFNEGTKCLGCACQPRNPL